MQSLLLIVSHRSIRTGRGNIRPAFGNYTREQAFFTRKFSSSGRFAPAAGISGLRSETTPANKPFSPGSSFPPVDSRRPRKYPACVWKLHPRTSLFHPEVLFLQSIRAGRGNIRPAFGNYTREQAFFTRKFFSSGRFAPAAEISGLRSETTPANKPFSPGHQ